MYTILAICPGSGNSCRFRIWFPFRPMHSFCSTMVQQTKIPRQRISSIRQRLWRHDLHHHISKRGASTRIWLGNKNSRIRCPDNGNSHARHRPNQNKQSTQHTQAHSMASLQRKTILNLRPSPLPRIPRHIHPMVLHRTIQPNTQYPHQHNHLPSRNHQRRLNPRPDRTQPPSRQNKHHRRSNNLPTLLWHTDSLLDSHRQRNRFDHLCIPLRHLRRLLSRYLRSCHCSTDQRYEYVGYAHWSALYAGCSVCVGGYTC